MCPGQAQFGSSLFEGQAGSQVVPMLWMYSCTYIQLEVHLQHLYQHDHPTGKLEVRLKVNIKPFEVMNNSTLYSTGLKDEE